MSQTINKVAIFGGTHGNELTGVFQVKKYQQSPDLIQRESFKTVAFLANHEAIKKVVRYIDTDLNRCFKSEDLLNQNLINYEQQLAKKIAKQIKEENIDLIIDIHSTTSNMGLTIILHNENPYLLRLAAYLIAINPLVKVLKYPLNPNPPYLRAITEMGLGIEVGAIAQGVLNADLFFHTEELITQMLDFIELSNQERLPEIPKSLTVYQQIKTVDYPRKSQEIIAMIHPELQNKDYQPLNNGDPIFITFTGETISYEEKDTVYPVFINEAAYYEKGIAMTLTRKIELPISK